MELAEQGAEKGLEQKQNSKHMVIVAMDMVM